MLLPAITLGFVSTTANNILFQLFYCQTFKQQVPPNEGPVPYLRSRLFYLEN
jgi:hypothetical protein